jgi:hypothetical protein
MEYKGYNIQVEDDIVMYSIHMIGRGALPKFLNGLYTNYTSAKKQIDTYLEQKLISKE